MTVLQGLCRARARIVRCGWHQGSYGNSKVGFCVLGALPHAADFQAMRRVLAKAIGLGDGIGVGAWNDRPERTEAQVLAAFDRAISITREQSTR